MAAPMGKMRVKLFFRNIRENDIDSVRKCWFLLDKEEIKDIDAFSKEIVRRFGCSKNSSPQLLLDDCTLPGWEKTELLRDNDEIWVIGSDSGIQSCKPHETNGPEENDNEENDLSHVNIDHDKTQAEEANQSPKKKKKKTKKNKHSKPASDERKRKRHRSGSSSCDTDRDTSLSRGPRFKHDHGHHVISYDPPASPGVERTWNIRNTLAMRPVDMHVCASEETNSSACEVPKRETSPSPAKALKKAAPLPKDQGPTPEEGRPKTSEAVDKPDDGLTTKQRRNRKRKRVKRMKTSDKSPGEISRGEPSSSKATAHQIQGPSNKNLGRAPTAMAAETVLTYSNFNGNQRPKSNVDRGRKHSNRKHVIFESDSGNENDATPSGTMDDHAAEHSFMSDSPSISQRLERMSKNSDTRPAVPVGEMCPSVQCDHMTGEVSPSEEVFVIVEGSEAISLDRQDSIDNDGPRDSRNIRDLPRSIRTHEGTPQQPARAANKIWANVDSSGATSFSKGPFANVQVFNRRQRRLQKKAGFVPLSKEEQLNDTATNRSTIYVNPISGPDVAEPTSAEPTQTSEDGNHSNHGNLSASDTKEPAPPPKDYSQFSDLLGPPRPGDTIAYKILEMNEVYCPEVSEYKEARVLSFDSTKQNLVLEQTSLSTRKKAGRFDLTIEDEKEILTNDNSMESKVTLAWSAILEPKLVT